MLSGKICLFFSILLVKDLIFWGKEEEIRCCLNPFVINLKDRIFLYLEIAF